MAQQTFNIKNVEVKASNMENAIKIKQVILNILDNVPESVFVETLLPKIQKNPKFFETVMKSPLLKML